MTLNIATLAFLFKEKVHRPEIVFLISTIMSGYITFVNLGYSSTYFSSWFQSWYKAFPLVLVISYMVIPVVRRIIDKVSY